MNRKRTENILKIILVWLFISILLCGIIKILQNRTIAYGDYSFSFDIQGRFEKVWGIEVEESGEYNVNVSLKSDSEGVVTAYRLYSEEGGLVDYAIGYNLQKETKQLALDAGKYKLKVQYLSDDEMIDDFLKEVEASEEFSYDEAELFRDSVRVELDYTVSHYSERTILYDVLVCGMVIGSILGLATVIILCVVKKEEPVVGAKDTFARVGLALTVFLIFPISFSYTESFLGDKIWGEEYYTICETAVYSGLSYIIVFYVISFTSAYLLLKRVEKAEIIQHKMTIMQFFCCVCMVMTLYVGSTYLTDLFIEYVLIPLGWKGEVLSNTSNTFVEALLSIIGAPVFEELLCRKLIIDRTRKYGEGIAILISGLFFGLMHGTVSQNFMAAIGGLFLAYIYIRTGKIIYPIMLHMFINIRATLLDIFTTEIPSPWISQKIEMFTYMLAFAGLIMWIANRKKFYLEKAPEQLTEKKIKTVIGNYGFILGILVSIFELVLFSLFV